MSLPMNVSTDSKAVIGEEVFVNSPLKSFLLLGQY